MSGSDFVTRFAPSPTGHLHLGHAYSALLAFRMAQERGGRFILRIEDIDFSRCRPGNTEQIYEDLGWLGIEWETPVRIQSQHLEDYSDAARRLLEDGLLYPCFCTRKDILRELESAGNAPHGSEGPIYPGTCRGLSQADVEERIAAGKPYALRLNLEKALSRCKSPLIWQDEIHGPQEAAPDLLGDVVVVRKDIGTSYHLAVTVDDGIQGVTDVVRGTDLFESTHIHRVLQQLLGLPVPTYHHHELLTDDAGKRFAKRDRSMTLKNLRESGVTAAEIRAQVGF